MNENDFLFLLVLFLLFVKNKLDEVKKMEYENKKIEKKIGKVLYSLLDEYNKEADEYEKKGIDLKHNESNEYWGGFSMGVITAVKLIYMLLLKEGIEVKLEKSNDENIIKR